MMMMAELVQGQASVAQPGTKDDFADTIRRVRQMAAKMGGDQMPNMNNSSPVIDPSLYGFGGQKRSLDNGVGNHLGAMVHQRAFTTEDFKVPDKMVGFIIGKGGEQISRIQLESGCKIQIASDSGGMLDRPCTLTGSPENIDQAKRLLNEIVEQCRYGPGFHSDMDGNSSIQQILIPANKVGLVIGKGGETIKQLQERTGVQMIMIQDDPMPTGADKPLRITGDPHKVQQARELVVKLIREKDQGDFRSGRADFGPKMGGSSLDVVVPRFAVGIIIGRNGEMIKKIQNDAGVRIQFKQDDGVSPDRVAQVMGQADNCHHAIHLINELVQTAQERDGFGGVVGRRGRGDSNMGGMGGLQEVTYAVPADKCGLVIGKGGETIKNIKEQSRAHVELQRNPPPNTDPNVRIFSIRGTPQQLEKARQLIDERIGGPGMSNSSSFGMSPYNHGAATPPQHGPQTFMTGGAAAGGGGGGGGGGGWGTTFQIWQPQGQQDHSQQNQGQSTTPEYNKAWGQTAGPGSQQNSNPDYNAWFDFYRLPVGYFNQGAQQTQAPGLQDH
ncbi:far upstream element-binding protein 3 isoform X2 [Cynoglossus semilaevis]|uniref:Far upstream element (FUSE) binding protein 3 n=1 Tax=Cynoglossus semilaevis TaxID=244447 RepID=A0A3P8WR24_CYNSE|nr:far upstream element-binding protein 3 isoform X2 [Cynoglossus semilaevis]